MAVQVKAIRTGVFATAAERADITRRLDAIEWPDAESDALDRLTAQEAWDVVRLAIHKCAIDHGLPRIVGRYGIDGTGEFLAPAA